MLSAWSNCQRNIMSWFVAKKKNTKTEWNLLWVLEQESGYFQLFYPKEAILKRSEIPRQFEVMSTEGGHKGFSPISDE